MAGNSDSIEQVKKKIDSLIEQIRDFSRSDPEKAKGLSEEVIRLARVNGLKHQQANGMIYLANVVITLTGSTDAIDTAREAVELLGDSTDMVSVARAHTVLGNCLLVNSLIAEALEEYQIAIDLYKEIENYKGVSALLNNIAITYQNMGMYEQAFSAFHEAIEVMADSDYLVSKAAAMNNLASLLMDHDRPEKAESYLMESLVLYRRIGEKKGEGLCLRNIGELKAILGDFAEAEKYYLESIAVLKEMSSDQYLRFTLFKLSKLKEDQGQFEEAEKYLIQNVDLSKSSHSPRTIAEAEFNLASLRIWMGKTEGAQSASVEFIKFLKDSGEDIAEQVRVYDCLYKLHELKSEFREALEFYKEKSVVEAQIAVIERENDVVRVRLQAEFQQSESKRKLLEVQKEELSVANNKLSKALDKIKTLSGMLPICGNCKKIRNDSGYWEQIEGYITDHSEAVFSHSLCPECAQELYPKQNS